MTLIVVDGFDDGLLGYKSSIVGAPFSITSSGRNGKGLAIAVSGSTATNEYRLAVAEEDDELYIGMALKPTSVVSSSDFLVVGADSGLTAHIGFRRSGTSLEVWRFSGSTFNGSQLGATALLAFTLNTWDYFEFYVKLGDSPNGSVIVRKNGSSIISSGAADTKNAGTDTTFDFVRLAGTASGSWVIDDLYVVNALGTVNTAWLGDVTIQTIRPNGNGTYSELVGSDLDSTDNYLHVDDTTLSEVDYVGSPTNAAKDSYGFGDLTGSADVLGLMLRFEGWKTNTGAKSIRGRTRISGNDYTGADKTLTQLGAFHTETWETSPLTAVAWTASEVNGAEFGVEVRP